MHKNWVKRLGDRGDTMVEVAIAIVIVSFVLMSAYSLSHRSSQSIVDAKEHAQAVKYVESQIEYLRSNNGTSIANACFYSGIQYPSSNPNCTINPNGAGTAPAYNLNITNSGSSSPYSITATWDNIYGTGKASVQIFYRIVQ
ncbi:type II secretion system protein [Candidatus Saccharibacteria bacterium]|nr:type II secretion system protein [Candidatus Saccharibacteria bacterium]